MTFTHTELRTSIPIWTWRVHRLGEAERETQSERDEVDMSRSLHACHDRGASVDSVYYHNLQKLHDNLTSRRILQLRMSSESDVTFHRLIFDINGFEVGQPLKEAERL